MTDKELICNLQKRFSLNMFRHVGNVPSLEQKRCEEVGFSCCHSSAKAVASVGGGVTGSVVRHSCTRVKKTVRRQ